MRGTFLSHAEDFPKTGFLSAPLCRCSGMWFSLQLQAWFETIRPTLVEHPNTLAFIQTKCTSSRATDIHAFRWHSHQHHCHPVRTKDVEIYKHLSLISHPVYSPHAISNVMWFRWMHMISSTTSPFNIELHPTEKSFLSWFGLHAVFLYRRLQTFQMETRIFHTDGNRRGCISCPHIKASLQKLARVTFASPSCLSLFLLY